MWKYLLVLGMVFAVPSVGWSVAALTNTSFQKIRSTPKFAKYQMIRCDDSTTLTGADGPANGEACEDGDWTNGVDARPFDTIVVKAFEYGTGALSLLIWDCSILHGSDDVAGATVQDLPQGGGGSTTALAPGSPAGSGDPDPQCVDITPVGGINGLAAGVSKVRISGPFDFIYIELDSCTANCDVTVYLELQNAGME